MAYSIITGASSGIGKALAFELASRGRDVILVSLPGEGLENVAADIRNKHGRKAEFFETNLSDKQSPQQFFDWFSSKGFSADILVNNAGFGTLEPFIDSKLEMNEAMIMVNVYAPVMLTRLFLPVLKKEPRAWIMNLGSTAGLIPVAFKAGYCASKGYIYNFSRALGEELKPYGIGVTVICPGGVYTSEKVRERIHSAGFMTRKASLEPETVAKESVDAMFRGKAWFVPGFITRMVMYLSYILPFSFYGPRMARHLSRDFNRKS